MEKMNEKMNEKIRLPKLGLAGLKDAKVRKWPLDDPKIANLANIYNLTWNQDTWKFDCDHTVIIYEDLVENGKLIINFGTVNGDFYCDNIKLTTLEGCPSKVDGHFVCSENKLTSLKGGPSEVGGHFICYSNQLTSLDGAPSYIAGDFYYNDNPVIYEEEKFLAKMVEMCLSKNAPGMQ